MEIGLLAATLLGIFVLLVLILKLRIHAFTSLLISSIVVGLVAGMPIEQLMESIEKGMGGTLGFVALIIGLGALLGGLLEYSGAANFIAEYLLKRYGVEKAPWTLMIAGFIISIPVFFDVAFIILVPVIYAIQRRTQKSLLLYAIPLLAGLAVTHSFIPPTPGPVAVSQIIGADLGSVIVFGLLTGIPAAILAGPLFAKVISNKIHLAIPEDQSINKVQEYKGSLSSVLIIIFIPILLIVVASFLKAGLINFESGNRVLIDIILLFGHPFTALVLANMMAWYFLGIRLGAKKETLFEVSNKALRPTGIIILLTGAGGVFKQILIDTGTGKMLAELFVNSGVGILVFAFIAALLIRVLQGSATVAMITAAGLASALIPVDANPAEKALIVIAIASGASSMSHLNDSGFWLVKQYLGMTELQTFKSWTVMTTLISLVGFAIVLIIELFI